MAIHCTYIKRAVGSVTRFGEISPLWRNLKSLRQNFSVYLEFGIILVLLWQECLAIRQVFIVVDGQIF